MRLGIATLLIISTAGSAVSDTAVTGGSALARHGAHAPIAATAAFDGNGRLWRAADDGRHVVVSHSEDLGKHFSTPVRVNATPQKILADGENRPKIVPAPSGDIYVSDTQGLDAPYSGHVRFSRSVDGGKFFSEPVIVNDDRQPISYRFESFAVDDRGRIHIVWLDRRDWAAARAKGLEYAGIALYHAASSDGGLTFSRNERLAEHTCECCRVAIDIDRDGTPVIFWRHVYPGNVRDHALLRLDASRAVQRVSDERWTIDACPHHGGALAVDAAVSLRRQDAAGGLSRRADRCAGSVPGVEGVRRRTRAYPPRHLA